MVDEVKEAALRHEKLENRATARRDRPCLDAVDRLLPIVDPVENGPDHMGRGRARP